MSTPVIVSRREWGAREGTGRLDPGPEARVVIHHSYRPALEPTATMEKILEAWRGIERHHVHVNLWDGIGYNFGVAPDGTVLEGRGWKYRGSHAGPVNGNSIGICLLIDGTLTEPTDAMVEAVQGLIAFGVRLGEIAPNYAISGHRDHMARTCPGDKVYRMLERFRPTASAKPEPPPAQPARPFLKVGSHGPAVEEVQRLLADPPGRFGPYTEAAVRRFQSARGLLVDGMIGPNTWKALDAEARRG